MANVRIDEIQAALAATLQLITKADGYNTDFAANKFYECFDEQAVNQGEDSKYPKFFILLESGKPSRQPSGRTLNSVTFLLVAIFRKLASGDALGYIQAARAVDDVEKILSLNSSLVGNKVEDVWIDEYSTDAGSLHPEGAAVVKITCQYFKQL